MVAKQPATPTSYGKTPTTHPKMSDQRARSKRLQQVIVAKLNGFKKSSSDFLPWSHAPPATIAEPLKLKPSRRRRMVRPASSLPSYIPLMQQLRLHDAELAISCQPGAERQRTSAGGDVTAETNLHSDAFRKGTPPIAPPSLVQEWTGFPPVEDMAGGTRTRRPQQGKRRPQSSPSPRLSPEMPLAQTSSQDAGP